jgi:hypothetical protein
VARAEARKGRVPLRCAMCGGPRVPEGLGGKAAVAALRQSKVLDTRTTLARIVSILLAVLAALNTIVFLLALAAPIVIKLPLVACAAIAIAMSVRIRASAIRLDRKAKDAREEAWLAAAEDVATKMPGGITAQQLAARLHIDPEHADRLLTHLASTERMRIDVDDDAEVRFRAQSEITGGLRIDDDALFEDELFAESDASRARSKREIR